MNIHKKAAETDNKVSEIEKAMNEQVLASEEITKAVGNITHNSSEISDFAETTLRTTKDAVKKIVDKLATIKELKNMSEKLNQDLQKLKTK
jgi:methyl-accepting chemotaxis protein